MDSAPIGLWVAHAGLNGNYEIKFCARARSGSHVPRAIAFKARPSPPLTILDHGVGVLQEQEFVPDTCDNRETSSKAASRLAAKSVNSHARLVVVLDMLESASAGSACCNTKSLTPAI